MLRKGVFALASLAFLSGGAVQAQSVNSQNEPTKTAQENSDSAGVAPSVVAKVEVGATSSETPASSSTPAASTPAASESPASTDTKSSDIKSAAVKSTTAETSAPPATSSEEKSNAQSKPAPLPDPTLKVSIDLAGQNLTVSEHGVVKYSWPISSGTASHPTPRGTFRPQWTAKMWYSRKYDNAPMPNAVFIHGGVAIHATYATSMLGRPASHGCIRLAPSNAKTFYNLVHKHGLKMTRVSVYGTPNYPASVASRRRNAPTQQQYATSGSDNDFWSLFGLGSSSTSYNANTNKKRKGTANAKVNPYGNSKKYNGQRMSGNQARRKYNKTSANDSIWW